MEEVWEILQPGLANSNTWRGFFGTSLHKLADRTVQKSHYPPTQVTNREPRQKILVQGRKTREQNAEDCARRKSTDNSKFGSTKIARKHLEKRKKKALWEPRLLLATSLYCCGGDSSALTLSILKQRMSHGTGTTEVCYSILCPLPTCQTWAIPGRWAARYTV